MAKAKRRSSRQIRHFFSRPRYVIAGIIVATLSLMSLSAEVWSNNKPLLMRYQGEYYFPVFKAYHPTEFGIQNSLRINYRELSKAESESWVVWPLNPWGPFESNKSVASFPSPPSAENLLGTDDRGRDILARLIYGLRYSLLYAALVWILCTALAILIGGFSGFIGGRTDLFVQRIIEVLSTVPQFLLLLFVIAVFTPSLPLLIVFSSLLGWIGLSYYVRGEVLKNRRLEFAEAARASGASETRILLRHVLPNALTPVVTFAPFLIVGNIVGLAMLDFMGFGLPPPTPSWGELLQQAKTHFQSAWWLAVFPSVALFVALLSFTLLGEGLRTALDPRQLD